MSRYYMVLVGLLGLALAGGVGCGGNNDGGGGTGGSGGTAGTGGTGGTGGVIGTTESKVISLGCRNSVTDDVSILNWTLTATSEPIEPSSAFNAEFEGIAVFPESFLNTAQNVIQGGVKTAALLSTVATVRPRSGATGDAVTLGPVDLPYTCQIPDAESQPVSCDPANETDTCLGGANATQPCATNDDCPGSSCVPGANTDCEPVIAQNPCRRFVDIPVTEGTPLSAGGCTPATPGLPPPDCDCAPCTAIDAGDGVKTGQCTANGFCVSGPLEIGLKPSIGTFTATDAEEVLFGWDDQDTGATVTGEGTYDLIKPTFQDPTTPTDLRVQAGAIPLAVTCTMAVDSAGPDGVATCSGGANDGMSCESPEDNSNDSCVGGTNEG
ncbi:MAG: hypothetical protein WBM46_09370, partial [Polyangiales bacterium]